MGRIRLSQKSQGWRFPRAVLNRFLHCIARYVPMFPSTRVLLHRLRGVKIGKDVFIGIEVFIDDAEPDIVTIEDEVSIIARASIIAHAHYPLHLEKFLVEAGRRRGVTIKRGAYVGFGAMILPGVTIGQEAVVGAGTVVTKDVPARAVVLGTAGRIVKHLDETPENSEAGDDSCAFA